MIQKYLFIVLISFLFIGCGVSKKVMIDTSTWSQDQIKSSELPNFNQWLGSGAKASKIDSSIIISMIDDRFKDIQKQTYIKSLQKENLKSPKNIQRLNNDLIELRKKYQLQFLAYTFEYYVQYLQFSPITKQTLLRIEKYNRYWKKRIKELDRKKQIKQNLARLNRYAPVMMAALEFEKAKNIILEISKEIKNNRYLLEKNELLSTNKALNGLLAMYHFYAGEFDISITYLKKEIELYKQYIKNNEDKKWVYYMYNGYLRAVSDLSHAYARIGKSANEIIKLDQDDEFLNDIIDDGDSDKWSGRYNYYAKVSLSLAIVGDYKNALKYIELAKESAKDENEKIPYMVKYLLLSYEAKVYFYKKDYTKSLELYKKASMIARNNTIKVNYRSEGQIAMVLEKLGDYSKALFHYEKSIKMYENIRGSYIVNARGKFFESEAKEVYWGYARTSALIYKKTKDNKDFIKTLYSMELLKARQLGDTKLSFESKEKNIQNISKYMKKISHNNLFVDYLVTDEELITLYLSNSKKGISISKLDKQFKETILDIKADLADPSSDIEKLNRKLSNLSGITLNPFRDLLEKKSNLSISNDGILNIIPFEVLSLKEKYEPLVLSKNLLYVPSFNYMTSSNKIKKRQKKKEVKKQKESTGLFQSVYSKINSFWKKDKTNKKIVNNINRFNEKAIVFANPTYKNTIPHFLPTITRGSKYLEYFTPLEETQIEAKNIKKSLGSKNVTLYTQKNAKETNIKKLNLSQYRYLHFATHGIIGGEVPTVDEPALVLANEPRQDGFLKASEVEKLKLNAKLAVLSACNTGSGKFVTGEGVLGISRAFLVAGTNSVVVSLWQVPSDETVDLMEHFYKDIARKKNSVQSLRDAKIKILKSPKYSVGNKQRALKIKKKQKTTSKSSCDNSKRGLKLKYKIDNRCYQLAHPYYWAAFINVGK